MLNITKKLLFFGGKGYFVLCSADILQIVLTKIAEHKIQADTEVIKLFFMLNSTE